MLLPNTAISNPFNGAIAGSDATNGTAPQQKSHSTNGAELTLRELLVDVLGYTDDDEVIVGWEVTGHNEKKVFRYERVKCSDIGTFVLSLGPDTNVWFNVNPSEAQTGRGKAVDVTRVTALYADLDVKPGACPNLEAAEAIIADLSAHLGTEPTAVTFSGRGLQPFWSVADGGSDVVEAGALLKRFGRLAQAVAKRHGAQKLDSVFDVTRMLRVPGSTNVKYPDRPLVRAYRRGGRPLSLAEIDDALCVAGVYGSPDDRISYEVVSDPASWAFAAETCKYAQTWIAGIPATVPEGGRHQWLLNQAVRIHCAKRLGCFAAEDFEQMKAALMGRMEVLRMMTGDAFGELEFDAAMEFGVEKASQKPQEEVLGEVGDHGHRWPSGPDDPYPCARKLIKDAAEAGTPIINKDGEWYRWDGIRYVLMDAEAFRDYLYPIMSVATYQVGAEGKEVDRKWKPKANRLNDLIDAARGRATVPNLIADGDWIDERDEPVVALLDGLLRVRDMKLLPHTPDHFHTECVPVRYEDDCPGEVSERFITQAIPDEDARETFFELAGCWLMGEPRFQKILVLVGKPGTGKDTLITMVGSLLGGAYGGMNYKDYNRNGFPKEPFIGKRLYSFSDMRRFDPNFVELLIQVSGRSKQTVRLPYGKRSIDVILNLQFVIMENNPPQMDDAANALARRLIAILMGESAVGREDFFLGAKLAGEASWWLRKLIDGYDRAMKRGRIEQPKSGEELRLRILKKSNPYRAFADELLECGGDYWIFKDSRQEGDTAHVGVMEAWRTWCQVNHPEGLVIDKNVLCDALINLSIGIKPGHKGSRGNQVPILRGVRLKEQSGDGAEGGDE